MLASLREDGRMAVVLDTGAVSRGSGNEGSNKERDVRKAFVEGRKPAPTTPGQPPLIEPDRPAACAADLIEAVVLLPENLFYNTTAPGIILVVNRAKRHPGEILLINASTLFSKGRPKNALMEAHVAQIATVYHDWQAVERLSAVVTTAEVARNDY
jgi:type I restriction enzyme M protein